MSFNIVYFQRETVLLAEDEEMVREVTAEMLQLLGCTVIPSSDGAEAVARYHENMDAVDLVLMDVMMPHMNGIEAYHQMKKINPHVKVLFMSGFTFDNRIVQILSQGGNGFIQKPYTLNSLSVKMKEMFAADK